MAIVISLLVVMIFLSNIHQRHRISQKRLVNTSIMEYLSVMTGERLILLVSLNN